MSDLYELLAPSLDVPESPSTPDHVQTTTTYLNRLTTLSLSDLTSTEPASLLHAAQSHLRNLQALSKRSHKAVITSSAHLSELSTLLPTVEQQSTALQNELPQLETAATEFAQKYDRSTENAVLDRRKRAMLLSRNVDRVGDMMDLPTLLSSTVSAASASANQQTSTASFSSTSYASALDLHAHIKRLRALYPDSELVATISTEAAQEVDNLASILIGSLQSQNLKLAAAMRTIGWLRRVAPDLAEDERPQYSTSAASSTINGSSAVRESSDVASKVTETDGALGSLFLVCRLQTLHRTLEALEPLRELADQETVGRKERQKEERGGKTKGGKPCQSYGQQRGAGGSGEGGSQTERYLKRYLEIFREQSFGIVSMYKSIFPGNLPETASSSSSTTATTTTAATTTAPSKPGNEKSAPNDTSSGPQEAEDQWTDPLHPLPSPLSSFSLHLVSLLKETLHLYLPNLTEKSSRESLLTQVLYCASSLGRLGADFGMVVAEILGGEGEEGDEDGDEEVGDGEEGGDEGQEDEEEWIQIMKKHRIQASRLEVLARGVGGGGGSARKASGVGVESPPPSASPSEAVAG
ncbi:Dor1-domain-containing protein [Hortaea werneckii]|nr:Dor1-domain-containing protein [Hortaea werneckii]KAI7103937.1 Dor1-domain-containing protein [Hortaea werneckii]KAI7242570.1 Dor1-domain-containing protein [Hortaea werneckii]KAI7296429.1 Dor1-domain-containing protein [Hortaea werneckii]KAI7374875.1 Dor1-domain-containing protein [Hortaea werneckii]